MKVVKNKYKCVICKQENEYLDYMSFYSRGHADFDGKPVGSMMSIGANIKECPNCHYANYKIDEAITNNLYHAPELWNRQEYQNIIKNYSNPLRKILLVAHQYEHNLDYQNAYRHYILASWVAEGKEASDFRRKAIGMFIDKVLPNRNDDLFQIADLIRMEEEFDIAKCFTNALKELTDQNHERNLKAIITEEEFINNKDSQRHNLKEAFE